MPRCKLDYKAVELYRDTLYPLQDIAVLYGCSRMGVKKYLNRQGVDTSKRKLQIKCHQCGITFDRHRKHVRRSIHSYCSKQCYHKALHNPGLVIRRQGGRLAHKAVSKYMVLSKEQVVHHIDGNQNNNDIGNLIVFACNADHIRWHRGDKSKVVIVWSYQHYLKYGA